MIDATLLDVVGGAAGLFRDGQTDESTDQNTRRLLDAALKEASAVGMARITVEEVVRRAGVSRMTAYRRYPRRDNLVAALAHRETQRFLAAVADAIEATEDPDDGVVEAFIAAVTFAREHPILRRAAHTDPTPTAEARELVDMGSAFIANYMHADAQGEPSQSVRWVAGVFARLFFTYLSMPPTDPDFGDDAQLRRFAQEVLTPMARNALG